MRGHYRSTPRADRRTRSVGLVGQRTGALRFIAPLLLCGGLLAPLAAGAEAPSGEAEKPLEAMSLKELLDIRVVTPTTTAESAAESPAVISVLTADQIRRLGVTTLYEALSYLPGVQVTESYFGYTMVNVRGLLQSHYNNKVLLMINGHPTREVVNGSFHLEIVPISAVSRIELVRGPGSALYGTNAFAGVINVITKKGADPASRELGLGLGSFDTVEASAVWGGVTRGLDYLAAATLRDGNGYPFRVEVDEAGQAGTIDYTDDVTNAFASLEHGDFSLFVAHFTQDKQKFGIVPVIAFDGLAHYRASLVDLRWRHEWTGGTSLGARLRYDEMRRSNDIGHFPYDGFAGHADADTVMRSGGSLFGADLSFGYAVSPAVSLLAGAVYERRSSDPYTWHFKDDGSLHPNTAFSHDASAHDLSIYAQGLIRLSGRTEAVAGFRFNDDSDAGATFVPRAGLVHRVAATTFVKLLFAEAYRTPDFFEEEVETYNVLYGDPELTTERTRNLDLALDTTLHGNCNLRLDAFYLTTSDLIVRIPTADPATTGANALVYTNGGGETVYGLEAALMLEPSPALSLFANYSLRRGEDRESGEGLDAIARHLFNLGLDWRPLERLGVAPNLQYVSGRGNQDPYLLANLRLELTLSPGVQLAVAVRNLGDERYAYPEYIRGIAAGVPGGPERSATLRLRWRPRTRAETPSPGVDDRR